ncbi:GNAT family N-acetyltransferase [Streptomyces capparidis]
MTTSPTAGLGSLAEILAAAERGSFPPPDGSVTVVPPPSPRGEGVVAFTAHSVVFTAEDPRWVRETLAAVRSDPLAATLNPSFLVALAARTGRRMDTIDALVCAPALPGPPERPLTPVDDPGHPRVVRARRYRDDVRVWAAPEGVVVLGRGLAGRWEVALELDEGARCRGAGRALARAARHLVPDGAAVWAQVPPGNARSARAFQAAGYRPMGAEALLIRA